MGRRALSLAAVRRLLLADPAKLDVREAAVRVIAKRDKCSVAEARFGLAELRDHVIVDRVYKRVLPEEHAREKGSVAQRRVHFFRAVERHFPVDWDYLDMVHMEMGNYDEEGELTADDFFEYGIAILSMRPFQDWDFNAYWDKHRLVYQLADLLFVDKDEARPNWSRARKWEYIVQKLHLDGPVKRVAVSDTHALLKAFEHARGPLKYLPAASNVLAFQTGSVFYDFDPDDGIEPWAWTRGDVEFLSGQAQIARQIEKQVAALGKWLDAAPREHAQRILNYYTKHRRILSYESKQGHDADTDPRALVNVLSGSTRMAQEHEARRAV